MARKWGRLAGAAWSRVGEPRRRALDLAIAVTSDVHGVLLLTLNPADLQPIGHLDDLRAPQQGAFVPRRT